MNPRIEDGPLPGLDALLGRVGGWLLVGDTVAMMGVALVPGSQRHDDSTGPVDAQLQIRIG